MLPFKRKRFFIGIEIILGIVLMLGLGSGTKNVLDRRTIKKLNDQNKSQAVKIDKLVLKVDDLNTEKDELTRKKTETEKALQKKAATGFSVLYEQSIDVHKENPTLLTKAHNVTASKYVQTWGYESMAQVIKWQQSKIDIQIAETKSLMEKNKKLEEEYNHYRIETEDTIRATKEETEKHKNDAETLKNKMSVFMENNNWLNKLIFYICIGGGIYLFITLGGVSWLFTARSTAIKVAQQYKTKKNAMVKAIKAFTELNEEGNATMSTVVNSLGVELDDEDEDECPIKTYKRNKKRKKNV